MKLCSQLRGRSLTVVPLERLLIVGALVAEDRRKASSCGPFENQPIPKIVSDLMAKMPQKSAVRLFLQRALLFAMHIVSFGNVDGDQPIVVSREYALGIAIRGVLQKLKREPVACRRSSALSAAQAEQRVQHAPLGDLESEPCHHVALDGQIGNNAIQSARSAEATGVIGRNHPIAHAHLIVIRAQPIAARSSGASDSGRHSPSGPSLSAPMIPGRAGRRARGRSSGSARSRRRSDSGSACSETFSSGRSHRRANLGANARKQR